MVYQYGNKYHLNEGQSGALQNIADMLNRESGETPFSLVHGKNAPAYVLH